MEILIAVLWFMGIAGVLGVVLALASKIFEVKVDERIPKIIEALPGANCGGCGYPGCSGLAQAIVEGKAGPSACKVGGQACADAISEIMGVEAKKSKRMRAQVMCSGTCDIAKKKYNYAGVHDCISASKLDGGAKKCPNGCLGLGTCVKICPFGAISVRDGVAFVDYEKCTGCGRCATACPKHIIRLIPYDAKYWVGCMSVDNGKVTRSYCDAGCISCKICEKNCEHDAVHVNDFVSAIDYSKCVGCGKCAEKCPRKIIWSRERQSASATIKTDSIDHSIKGTGEHE